MDFIVLLGYEKFNLYLQILIVWRPCIKTILLHKILRCYAVSIFSPCLLSPTSKLKLFFTTLFPPRLPPFPWCFFFVCLVFLAFAEISQVPPHAAAKSLFFPQCGGCLFPRRSFDCHRSLSMKSCRDVCTGEPFRPVSPVKLKSAAHTVGA